MDVWLCGGGLVFRISTLTFASFAVFLGRYSAPRRRIQPFVNLVAFPSLFLLGIILTASPPSSSAINIDVSKFVEEMNKRGPGDHNISAKDVGNEKKDSSKKTDKKDAKKKHEAPTPEQYALAIETFFGKEAKVPTHTYDVRERLRHDPIAFTQVCSLYWCLTGKKKGNSSNNEQ